jgi:signal transduction histidine kinase
MKNFLKNLTGEDTLKPGDTYHQELNRQCRFIAAPTFIIFLVSWLPYISLDINLYPDLIILPLLRIGLSLVGLLGLALFFVPSLKSKNYELVLGAITYLFMATALILGLVRANPVYMGGFSMLVMIIPVLPFHKGHSFLLLFATVVLFAATGFPSGMAFKTWLELYGAFNLTAALLVTLMAIFIIEQIRWSAYDKSCSLYQANLQLQQTSDELRNINGELEKTTVALEDRNEELFNANEIKSQLMGIVAHDLRNPLQVIIGYTEMLQEEIRTMPDAQDQLEVISNSSDKIMVLIDNLLLSNRVSEGKLNLNMTQVDLAKMAQMALMEIKLLADKKGQEMILDAPQACHCQVDEMLFRQVVDNLISNAVKFTPPKRRIWVKVEKGFGDDQTPIVRISVQDEGPGLTDEDKKKIFGRFQKLSARPTGGEVSTGLGLSIIKELVSLHKGRIHIQSEPGQGCTFTVDLPAG